MKKKIVSIFLTLIMLGMCSLKVIASSVSELQNKKDELESQRDEAKNQKEEVTAEKESIMDEILELTAQIDSYKSQIDELNEKIDTLEDTITTTEQEIKELEQETADKEELLLQRLVAIYENGQTTYLDALLGSQDISAFISNYYRIEEIAEADQTVIDSIKAKQKETEEKKQQLEKKKNEIDESKKEIEAKNQSLETAQAKKQVVVANLEQQEDELQAQIDEFESAIEDAQDEIDDIIAQNNASSGGSGGYIGSFEGTLSWPVSSSTPWYNYISSYFGPRPSPTVGASSNHGAVDIPVSYAPVYAPADGKVIIARWLSGYGNYIMIDHGDGYYTGFGHLSGYNVSEGQTVSRGEQIATSGNTGISTGPHLHYEVYIGGTDNSYRVDPLQYTTHPTLYPLY